MDAWGYQVGYVCSGCTSANLPCLKCSAKMFRSGFYLDKDVPSGQTDVDEGVKVVQRAMDLGITHLDTSDVSADITILYI